MTATSSASRRLRHSIATQASAAERRAAVRALLRTADELDTLPSDTSDSDAHDPYEKAIDSATFGVTGRLERRAQLRATAEELADRLVAMQSGSWNEAFRIPLPASPDQLAMTVETIARRVDRLALDEPPRAIELARFLALWIESSSSGLAPEVTAEHLARARAALAEAYYRAGDLVEAERALIAARAAFEESTLAPSVAGELARIEGAIRSDQSRFKEARKSLIRAVRCYRRAGERAAEARATISLALKWYYEGELERALETTDRALGLLDLERDGRLRFAAEFNRVFWQNDSGMHEEARAALPRIAELVERHGSRSDRIRLAWLEARIVAREGDLERAVELYRDVLAQCLQLEVLYDSATVAFELAILLLELGRAAEVLPLAETVARVFATQGAAPEAGAAVLLAADALRRGAAAQEALRLLRERERRGKPTAR